MLFRRLCQGLFSKDYLQSEHYYIAMAEKWRSRCFYLLMVHTPLAGLEVLARKARET
jgi:hypothetical protein